jgi:hypothetical protein
MNISNKNRDQFASSFLSKKLTNASTTIITEPKRSVTTSIITIDAKMISTSSIRNIPKGVLSELDIILTPQ